MAVRFDRIPIMNKEVVFMRKRILSLVAVVALLMTLFSFTSIASADMNYYAYSCCSNGKPLNVRSGPSKDYEVIGSIKYGEQTLVYKDLGNGWSELYWGSVPGYVMTSLLSRSNPGKYVPPTDKDKTTTDGTDYNTLFQSAKLVTPYTVTLNATANSKGVANVRWAPSKSATLLMKYPSGTEVTVIAEVGKNWYQVSDPVSGAVGFVNTAYVTK